MVLCIPPAILNHQALQLNLWRHDTPVTAEVLCIECLFCLEGICFRLCCLCKMHASPVWWTQCSTRWGDSAMCNTKNPQDNLAVLHEAFAQEPFGMGIRELSHGCPWALGCRCWQLRHFTDFTDPRDPWDPWQEGPPPHWYSEREAGTAGNQLGTRWGIQVTSVTYPSVLPLTACMKSTAKMEQLARVYGVYALLVNLNYIIIIFSIPGPTLQVSPTSSGQSIKTAYPKAKECEDAIAALPSEARLLAYLALEVGTLGCLGSLGCLRMSLCFSYHWDPLDNIVKEVLCLT